MSSPSWTRLGEREDAKASGLCQMDAVGDGDVDGDGDGGAGSWLSIADVG